MPDNIYCLDSLGAFREIDFAEHIKVQFDSKSENNELSVIPLCDDNVKLELKSENINLNIITSKTDDEFVDVDQILSDTEKIDWQKLNESTPKSSTNTINKRPSKRTSEKIKGTEQQFLSTKTVNFKHYK